MPRRLMLIPVLVGIIAGLGWASAGRTADLGPVPGPAVLRKDPPQDPGPDPDRPKKPRRVLTMRKDPPPDPKPDPDRPKKPRRSLEFWLPA